MASTWKELNDDFIDRAKIYTEKIDVTEVRFMRMCTEGMQIFQRATELKQSVADFPYVDALLGYPVSQDVYRIVEIREPSGMPVLPQEWSQYMRNKDLIASGYFETPSDFSRRLRAGGFSEDNIRIASMYNWIIYTDPSEPLIVAYLRIWYIPEYHKFSGNSPLWMTWFPINDNFDDQFTTTGPDTALAPYENAFVDYAMYMYLEAQKHKDAIYYQQKFMSAIEKAILEKPTMFQEAVADYHMAPYS